MTRSGIDCARYHGIASCQIQPEPALWNCEDDMRAKEPNLITSGYSGPVSKDGVTIQLSIYRLEESPDWTLEVVNSKGTSTVWEGVFASDDLANAEFLRTVAEEGMDAFRDTATIVPFRR
jgi:hypothetical protein